MLKLRTIRDFCLPVSVILAAVSFTLIYDAPEARGGNLKKSRTVSAGGSASKATRKITPEAPPEAGVKLLMGILKRIGSAPQIAMKQVRESRQRLEQGQFNQFNQTGPLFNQNAGVKTELAIRPRVTNYSHAKKARKQYSISGSGKNQVIAYNKLPSSKASSLGRSRSSEAELSDLDSANVHSGSSENSYARGMSKESQNRLKDSAKKLFGISSLVSNIGGAPGASGAAAPAAEYKSKGDLVKASSPRGKIIAQSPKIVDYRSDSRSLKMEERLPVFQGATNGTIYGDEGVAHKSLDQPSAFRHMREYGSKLPSQEPADMLDDEAETSRGNQLKSAFGRRQDYSRLAYVPPNLISGVPGLRLGASHANVVSFLKGKGNVDRAPVDGWDVWVLKNAKTGKASLQVYMRNGIVEAFRIFDSKYVPSRLKISLDTPLEQMKEKFGEPAFILYEPSTGNSIKRGVKNYVYPVSQVSFQLARSNSKSKKTPPIQIKSMLIFKFL